MLTALGRFVIRRPLTVIAMWFVLAAIALTASMTGFGGPALFAKLETGQPSVPGSDSAQVADVLAGSRTGATTTLLVDGADPRSAALRNHIESAGADLGRIPGVAEVATPFAGAAGAVLLAPDGDALLVRATLDVDLSDDAESAAASQVESALRDLGDTLVSGRLAQEAQVSSIAILMRAVNHQMERDLVRGELVALPVALLVMVIVFGGVMAAGMPILGALVSIAGGLGSIWLLSHVMDLDSVVINVVTLLGLGLSVDYGLLVVSRFREEVIGTGDRPDIERAVERTIATSGRTVVFSALTIAMSVGGLIVMSPSLLQGLGVAAASVVVIALLSAVTLVPAVLVVFGHRLQRPSALSRVPVLRGFVGRLGAVAPEQGMFSALAAWVQRHAWPVLLGSVAILIVAATPVLSIHLRNSGIDVLPQGTAEREAYEAVGDRFPALADPDVWIVSAGAAITPAEAATLSGQFAAVEGVASVDDPREIGGDAGHVLIGIRLDPRIRADSAEAVEIVRNLRDLDTPIPVLVGGQAAGQADFATALVRGLPYAGGLVLLATFVLLFLMTGSVLVPAKALITNMLSIAASLGITTWVFQEGRGAGLLGFEPVGGLESYVVAVVVAFGFGLAMDYEVFLIARIKEFYDLGLPNDEAVVRGLQGSGRIITSAALVIIVVFAGFASGLLLPIKEAGFALALAVALDATIVRMLLVPATMTVLGDANWWAPAWLKPLSRRFSIRH